MLALEWNMNDALAARFEDGYEDGRNEERESVAIKLIRRGRPLQEIHEDTGLSLHRLEQLANDNCNDYQPYGGRNYRTTLIKRETLQRFPDVTGQLVNDFPSSTREPTSVNDYFAEIVKLIRLK